MRVALIGAEFEENLAVRYLVAALEAKGHDVSSIVFNDARDTEAAARRLAASGAELAGLSMVFTYRAREFAGLATRARAMGFAGHITAGGHFAAFHGEDLLLEVPAIDSIAIGEGEAIVCDLASHLGDLGRVRGLVWRSAAGIVHNPPADKPADLDRLAVPRRKDPLDHYHGIPITNILASRGCAHACSFCSISAWHRLCGGDRVRLRAPDRVADEMAMLYRRGARIFNFHDDSFVLRDAPAFRARAAELSRALDGRGLGRIAFAIKSRPDAVSVDSFAPLKRMGLFRVFLGIEAGTEESLRRLGRNQSLADNVRALEVMEALDLHAAYNVLLLNPDSTLEDVEGNVAFLRAHAQFPTNFCRTEVYTGTPLERRLRRDGRLLGTFWGYDYRIADPRAQAAFELIAVAFRHRNHASDGLHHMAMALDYEYQLSSHFRGASDSLRRRVKQLVVEINENTCDHLGSVIRAVRCGPLPEALADRIAGELVGTIEEDGRALGARAEELLEEIRCKAADREHEQGEHEQGEHEQGEHEQGAAGWRRTAASVGIAATLALAGCKDRSGTPLTHPSEMVAPPASVDADAVSPEDGGPPTVVDDAATMGRDEGDAAMRGDEGDAAPDASRPKKRPRVKAPHPTHPMEMVPWTHENELVPFWPDRDKN